MNRGRALGGLAAALLVLLGAAQLIRRPALENPPVVPTLFLQAHVQVPADIDSILRRACYDCHSNETRWPFYARLAPVSWLIDRDVKGARADLNFSEWGTDPAREPTPSQRLGGICSDLRKGIMPPRSYLLMHRSARVAPAEVERICLWTTAARQGLQSGDDSSAAIPNTPAGNRLGQWLGVFNSGHPDSLVEFARRSWAPASFAEMPAEERAAWDAMIHRDNRRLRLRRAEPDGTHEVSALAQSELTGSWLRVRIKVEPQPPYRITELRIRLEPPPPAPPHPRRPDSAIAREAEDLIDRLTAADAFSGVVMVVGNGDTLLSRSVGMANRTSRRPNQPGTRFNIASMNKMFTAVAVVQLAQAGRLRFTDPVGAHLPDYPNKTVAAQVTIHHLLTHTAGLGMYWTPEYERVKNRLRSTPEFLALVAAESPAFPPGERFRYSNNGYVVLGAIIERVSGQDYYSYVRDHVFRPAGMAATASLEKGADPPDLAVGYTLLDAQGRARFGGLQSNEDALGLRGSSAGGGHSTAPDLLRFADALQRHRLLDSAHTARVLEGKVAGDAGMYGYGFETVLVNGQRIAGHSGGFPGIAARLDIYLDSGYTVVILGNYDSAATFAVSTLLRELLTAPSPRRKP